MTNMHFGYGHEVTIVTLETGCVRSDLYYDGRVYDELHEEFILKQDELPKFIQSLQRSGFRYFYPQSKF